MFTIFVHYRIQVLSIRVQTCMITNIQTNIFPSELSAKCAPTRSNCDHAGDSCTSPRAVLTPPPRCACQRMPWNFLSHGISWRPQVPEEPSSPTASSDETSSQRQHGQLPCLITMLAGDLSRDLPTTLLPEKNQLFCPITALVRSTADTRISARSLPAPVNGGIHPQKDVDIRF